MRGDGCRDEPFDRPDEDRPLAPGGPEGRLGERAWPLGLDGAWRGLETDDGALGVDDRTPGEWERGALGAAGDCVSPLDRLERTPSMTRRTTGVSVPGVDRVGPVTCLDGPIEVVGGLTER